MSTASTTTSTIEYVSATDTIADIALATTQSTSLRTSSAILLSLLFIASFILNLVVIAAILAGKKLRGLLFRRLLVLLCFVHLFFLFTVLLPSLIFVANGTWTLGEFLCRGNVFCQQFCSLYGTLLLVTMATERATTITQQPIKLFGGYRTAAFMAATIAITVCLTIPILAAAVPVRPFTNRYLCSIAEGAPMYRALVQVIVYILALVAMLVCTGAIYMRRQISSIPQQSHEFTQFITKTRALQEDTLLGKLSVRLFCAFVIIVGPYAVMELVFEISGSIELNAEVGIQQDVDTLLTWLCFVYPLIAPILICCSCDDIWSQVLETFCCKSQEPPTIGPYFMGAGKNNPNAGVMTLVATSEGVQLRLPQNVQYPIPQAPAYDDYLSYPTPRASQPSIESTEVEEIDEYESPAAPNLHNIRRNAENRRSRIPEPQAGPSVARRTNPPQQAGGVKKMRKAAPSLSQQQRAKTRARPQPQPKSNKLKIKSNR